MSPITHYTKLSKYMQGVCNGKYRGMLGLVWHRAISGFWGLVGNQDTPNPEKTKKIRVIPGNGCTPLYPFSTPDHRSITRLPLSPLILFPVPCFLFLTQSPINYYLYQISILITLSLLFIPLFDTYVASCIFIFRRGVWLRTYAD